MVRRGGADHFTQHVALHQRLDQAWADSLLRQPPAQLQLPMSVRERQQLHRDLDVYLDCADPAHARLCGLRLRMACVELTPHPRRRHRATTTTRHR